jgi:hypothetical protein
VTFTCTNAHVNCTTDRKPHLNTFDASHFRHTQPQLQPSEKDTRMLHSKNSRTHKKWFGCLSILPSSKDHRKHQSKARKTTPETERIELKGLRKPKSTATSIASRPGSSATNMNWQSVSHRDFATMAGQEHGENTEPSSPQSCRQESEHADEWHGLDVERLFKQRWNGKHAG